MKNRKSRIVFAGLLCMTMILGVIFTGLTAKAKESKGTDTDELIERFVDCVNKRKVQEYMGLFAPDIRKEMEKCLDEYGEDNFFIESHREIINIEKAGEETAIKEKKLFEDVAVYRVVENITYKEKSKRDTCELKNGINTNYFVLVKQNDIWYIYRISAAEGGQAKATNSLSCPSTTTIYFTKSANYNHYGQFYKSLNFNTYLKNVLPNEWYVSYYNGYPAYGRAGAMASKMYAWYYTKHPKWNYAPYYSCMFDSDSDQNFLYSAYSDMGSPYQGYEDTVLSFISSRAMVKASNESIFEVHYYANSGGYHSGAMNATECLSKAQSGDGYKTILHYYYDQSPYTGTSTNCKIVTY